MYGFLADGTYKTIEAVWPEDIGQGAEDFVYYLGFKESPEFQLSHKIASIDIKVFASDYPDYDHRFMVIQNTQSISRFILCNDLMALNKYLSIMLPVIEAMGRIEF